MDASREMPGSQICAMPTASHCADTQADARIPSPRYRCNCGQPSISVNRDATSSNNEASHPADSLPQRGICPNPEPAPIVVITASRLPEKIRVARYWIGEVGFELMESTTPDGPVARWIDKNGEGVMLVSFNVDNTGKSVAELQGKDYPFIPDHRGEVVRPFRDCEYALIHPKELNGVLTELIDYKWDELKEK